MLQPHLYADLIGKPFRDGARGPDAFDCWGLLQVVLRRMGHSPTDFPSDPSLLFQAITDEWQAVEHASQVQPGDGILLRSPDPAYQWHVGVVISPGHFLHTVRDVNACIGRYDLQPWRRRIAGFYRYRGLPA